jgi:molybdopterin molybdotransferase
LHRGEVITAAALATLAAVGITRPAVLPRLRLAVITTGDELIPPDHLPSLFQLRNSNSPAMRAILASHAWANITQVSHIRDDEDLVGALEHACGFADAVVLTGGVSMGHRDPVRDAVEQLGAEIVFHGLPQRPGKPMLGAILWRPTPPTARTVPIFGLPGNPVSALVTCVRVVLPVLAACAGAKRTPPQCLPRLIEVRNPDGRTLDLWWHRLVRLVVDADGLPRVELIDVRGSGDIVAAGMSDGFVEVPPGTSSAILPFYAWPAGAG